MLKPYSTRQQSSHDQKKTWGGKQDKQALKDCQPIASNTNYCHLAEYTMFGFDSVELDDEEYDKNAVQMTPHADMYRT